jgi:hypothetical protein
MRFEHIATFTDLKTYLAEFTNWDDFPVPYAFNFVFALLAALLDNLRDNALEADLEMLPNYLTDEQKAFLNRVAEYAMGPEVDG